MSTPFDSVRRFLEAHRKAFSSFRESGDRRCISNVQGACLWEEDLDALLANAAVTIAGLTPEQILAERAAHAEEVKALAAQLAQANATTAATLARLDAMGDAVSALGAAFRSPKATLRDLGWRDP